MTSWFLSPLILKTVQLAAGFPALAFGKTAAALEGKAISKLQAVYKPRPSLSIILMH